MKFGAKIFEKFVKQYCRIFDIDYKHLTDRERVCIAPGVCQLFHIDRREDDLTKQTQKKG